MTKFTNILGSIFLWLLYLGMAWAWTYFNRDISFDRALMIVSLLALAQIRWHQPDSGSVGKSGGAP